jgi:hypothetical protein
MGIPTTYAGQQYFVNFSTNVYPEQSIAEVYVSTTDNSKQANELALSFSLEKRSASGYKDIVDAGVNFVKEVEKDITIVACFNATAASACFVPEVYLAAPVFCTMEFTNMTENTMACIQGVASELSGQIDGVPGFSLQITSSSGIEIELSEYIDTLFNAACDPLSEAFKPVEAPTYPQEPQSYGYEDDGAGDDDVGGSAGDDDDGGAEGDDYSGGVGNDDNGGGAGDDDRGDRSGHPNK